MRGQKGNPNSKYHIVKHKVGNYCYAATIITVKKENSSHRVYNHWGKLQENKVFIPNNDFKSLSPNEQNKYIFPEDWDLKAIQYLKINNDDVSNEQKDELNLHDVKDINIEVSDNDNNNKVVDDKNINNNADVQNTSKIYDNYTANNKLDRDDYIYNKDLNKKFYDNISIKNISLNNISIYISYHNLVKNNAGYVYFDKNKLDESSISNQNNNILLNHDNNLSIDNNIHKEQNDSSNNIIQTNYLYTNSLEKDQVQNVSNNKYEYFIDSNNNDIDANSLENTDKNAINNYINMEGEADKIKYKIENKESFSQDILDKIKSSISPNDQFNNLLYGHVWFLLKIAEKYHVIEDLNIVFMYDQDTVNDILTLAIFPYLTNMNFDRCARWQNITKTPSNHKLTSSFITRFTQRINDNHRMTFIARRLDRQPSGSLVACDSTTRSAWGHCLAEIRWGKNKDNPKLKDTVEAVVYSLTTHEPLYYRSFAGNMVDIRTVSIIRSDFMALGIYDLTFLFDRGYESLDNIIDLLYHGISFLIFAKTVHEVVYESILTIQYDKYGYPINMEYSEEHKLYYTQIDLSGKQYTSSDGKTVITTDYKCNLYLDFYKRSDLMAKINIKIDAEDKLKEKIANNTLEHEYKDINKKLIYHKIIIKKSKDENDDNKPILEIVKNNKRIEKEKNIAGFFSCLNYKIDGNAILHLELYKLKDEQEKYFEQMKCQMNFHTQNCSSEDGKQGRLFILFSGLILSSKVRTIWRDSKKLREKYNTSYDILDEMKSIRLAEYSDGTSAITPFSQSQIDICKEYGIDVPEECLTTTERKEILSKLKPGRKKEK